MTKPQFTLVKTDDGTDTLMHHEHGECYHAQAGAQLEAEQLYVQGSGFLTEVSRNKNASRLENLRVLDIGLGLAYNAMSTISAWWDTPEATNLTLVSLEIDKDLVEAVFEEGLGSWQESWPRKWKELLELIRLAQAFTPARPFDNGLYEIEITHHSSSARLHWSIHCGDAKTLLKARLTEQSFDYFWQDPFSPTKNPGMWNEEWFSSLRAMAKPNAVLMSYSVARPVKDALKAAGWQFEKIPACGKKRSWLKAKPR